MTQEKKDKTPVQQLLMPSYILATGKILSMISPFLASRFAARLFLTPFRYKLPKREKKMDTGSKQTRATLPDSQREIVIYEYGTSPKKILLAHGWSGRGTQLSVMAEVLLKSGYSVVSFDAPAHGKAPGKTSMLPYFIEAIELVSRDHGPFKGLIAHSLGGMAALRAVSEGLEIPKLVIIGTANSITHITREFVRNLKMNREVATIMKSYFDKKFKVDIDVLSGAISAKDVKIPTLVVHDRDDVDVHVSSAYEIASQLENGRLLITSGLGHRRILGDSEVIEKISEFLSE